MNNGEKAQIISDMIVEKDNTGVIKEIFKDIFKDRLDKLDKIKKRNSPEMKAFRKLERIRKQTGTKW